MQLWVSSSQTPPELELPPLLLDEEPMLVLVVLVPPLEDEPLDLELELVVELEPVVELPPHAESAHEVVNARNARAIFRMVLPS